MRLRARRTRGGFPICESKAESIEIGNQSLLTFWNCFACGVPVNTNDIPAEGEVITMNFQTGKKIPPLEPGKVVELSQEVKHPGLAQRAEALASALEKCEYGAVPVTEPPRIVPADAQGRPKAAEPGPVTLTPFPDGYVFKFSENPARPGTFVVYDVMSRPVAICQRCEYADLICNAVRLLFMAAAENQRRQQAAAENKPASAPIEV